eukprot:235860-Chlamydomonas_euryale.AAC.4
MAFLPVCMCTCNAASTVTSIPKPPSGQSQLPQDGPPPKCACACAMPRLQRPQARNLLLDDLSYFKMAFPPMCMCNNAPVPMSSPEGFCWTISSLKTFCWTILATSRWPVPQCACACECACAILRL